MFITANKIAVLGFVPCDQNDSSVKPFEQSRPYL